jgi:hypothetical protein
MREPRAGVSLGHRSKEKQSMIHAERVASSANRGLGRAEIAGSVRTILRTLEGITSGPPELCSVPSRESKTNLDTVRQR